MAAPAPAVVDGARTLPRPLGGAFDDTPRRLCRDGRRLSAATSRSRALWLEDDGREARRPSREDPMNWNSWIRQIHRWLSIVFTLTVIANFVALTQGQPPAWVTYS